MPIDWAEAARLAAHDVRPSKIVAAVGCSRSQLLRRRRSCSLFRKLEEQHRAALAAIAAASTAPLSRRHLETAVRAKLEQEIADGNIKVALWLAERLHLFTDGHGDDRDDVMARLLDTMTPAERAAFTREE